MIQAAQENQQLSALQEMADKIHMKETEIEEARLRKVEDEEREAEEKVKEEEDIDSIYIGPDKKKIMRGKRHKRPT
ncbi:hypothetical protein CYMTET_7754 [Cymbomonas tetramitiformis]|uniref:Uncharacterized protein n=1 Tax=Cymbomonas tetramitiformis TaxID=36881 RepID=A0AAE0GUV9_9CHLO|nr:hypothetical protein CYMTET_7754 [Cymbomonas tetramitiformis]